MRICNGCGGIVGRDCFNPIECEWISQQQQANDNYKQGYQQAQIDAHEATETEPINIQEQPQFVSNLEEAAKVHNDFYQSQEQMNGEDEWIETATMWCEVIHAINEADKKGMDVGEIIPTILEKQFKITRK